MRQNVWLCLSGIWERARFKVELSICVVTLNAWQYLKECLDSITRFAPKLSYEIIVVDNHSQDGTAELLASAYPTVRCIVNPTNLGYTKAANQSLRAAQGDFLLSLNPDTILVEDVFTPMVDYLRQSPDVGVAIPKVLNQDGTFQRQSRRGEARPLEVLGYFLKLGRLFPSNKKLNGYLQTWLSEDMVAEVKAVSGSCMFIRRETWQQVGELDESFFAYQEDSDFCLRARQQGWKVMYVPLARIIHIGGEGGTKTNSIHSLWQWHRSYFLYYRKHFAKDYFFLFNILIYLLMALKLLFSLVSHFLSGSKKTERSIERPGI